MTTDPPAPATNAKLMARHIYCQAVRQQLAEEQHAIEVTLRQRMMDDMATVLADGEYEATLKYPAPGQDYGLLKPVLELVPEDVRAKGFTAAHEEVVQVGDRWDMRQVGTWGKYGAEAAAILEAAKIAGDPKVAIRRKEKENDGTRQQ